MALDQITAPTFAALTLDAPALKRALAMAGHVIEKRNSIPVLAMIRATVHPGTLTIAATDLDLQLTLTLPADTTDTASAVINPAGMAAAVAKVKGKAALLIDGAALMLEAGGATFEASDGLPVDDFPNLTPALYQDRATLPASVLLAAVQAMIPAVSTEQTRYYLNGAFFHGWQAGADQPATLRIVATDGHRLSLYDLPANWPAKSKSDERGGLILPRKSCEVLARLLKDAGDSEVTVSTDHTHDLRMMFSGDGWHMESKVIDGHFPDYTRVLPRDAAQMTFMLGAADIPAASRGKGPAVVCKLDADAGRMTWADGGAVAGRDLLANGTGAIGFNARYLADFAKLAPDGLTIEATGAGDPARILTADPRFVGVCMPMRC